MVSILEQVRSVLSTTPERWERLTGTLPSELLWRQPAPGEWSAVDCLQHLVETEGGIFPARVRHFLRGEDLPNFNPDTEGSQLGEIQPLELARTFSRLRGDSLHLLGELKEADLSRSARHEELGPVTLGQMLHEWAGHDLMHTVQAERALMQPFILGSGAWQPFFADHFVIQ
jgi:DinB superfamily